MYLDDLATAIREHVPDSRVPEGDADQLFRLYAVLLRAKGASVTQSDVHDAWSAWMAERDPGHPSIVEYQDLDDKVRAQDRVFATAVRSTSDLLPEGVPSGPLFIDVLFPSGPPEGAEDTQQALDLYKIMVASSESLVSRRQAVNTFFLTMNGALLTAAGLIVQGAGGNRVGVLGVAVLCLTGAILCLAWRSLITSFGQLNRGKFQVINTIERYLKTAIYAAEWEALGRGEDPKVYRSFTSGEIWVPTTLLVLYILAALTALGVAAGWVTIGIGVPILFAHPTA